jgi:hypothetical protein
MKALRQFISKQESSLSKDQLDLKENIDVIQQVLTFISEHPDVPNNIMTLKKHEDQWHEVSSTWRCAKIWDILTFYRSIEKLKTVKDYFDKPITDTDFFAEFSQCKNKYYTKILHVLSQYDTHYHFSKMMWDKINKIHHIKPTNNPEQNERNSKSLTP